MVEVEPSWAPEVPDRIAWVEIEGEIVALDRDSRQVHRISETGALLWQCLDGQATVEDLAHDVAAAFGIDDDRARADVAAFVAEMAGLGLLDPPPDP